jgi:hypothetical protein
MVPTKELRDKALWLAQVEEPIEDVVNQLAEWIKPHCITTAEYTKRLKEKKS